MHRVTVRGVDDHHVDSGIDQRFGALIAAVTGAGGSRDAQAALCIFRSVGIGLGLFHVGNGDQTDTAVLLIDHNQFLDTVLVQQFLGDLRLDVLHDGDEVFSRHQLFDTLLHVAGKAHVAVGDDADEGAGFAVFCLVVNDGNAGNLVLVLECEHIGQGPVRRDGDRIDHHAGFKTFDPANLAGLLFNVEIAVNDAHAAELRHGDGHLGFRDGVHGR